MDVDLGTLGVRPLKLPTSHTVRWEIALTGATNATRAFAAALGVSCPSLKLKAKHRGDVLAYGQEVMDELVEKGLTPRQVHKAGALAYAAIDASVSDLPSEDEVAEKEGFSGTGAPATG